PWSARRDASGRARTFTRSPRSTRFFTSRPPRKPVPPVTRTFRAMARTVEVSLGHCQPARLPRSCRAPVPPRYAFFMLPSSHHPLHPATQRRTVPRDPLSVSVSCVSDLFDGPVQFDARDVSSRGIFVRSPLLLHPGDNVLVSFEVPGTRHRFIFDASVA